MVTLEELEIKRLIELKNKVRHLDIKQEIQEEINHINKYGLI